MLDDGVMKIIMAIPDPAGPMEDPMAPGMHGETRTPGNDKAEKLLCDIKCMILEYFGENCPEDKPEAPEPETEE